MRTAWSRLRWPTIFAIAVMNFLVALLATAPLSPPLSGALDDRPQAAQVADAADDAPRAELLQDHPEISAIAIECAALALIIWGGLSWIFAGGLLTGDLVEGSARYWARMLKVGALGLPLRLLGLIGPLAALPLFGAATRFEGLAIAAVVAVGVGGAFWSLGTVTVDRAHGIAIAHPELSPWRSLRAAAKVSRQQFGATVKLAAISGLGFLALFAGQILITHDLPPTALGSLFALFVALLGAFARAALSALTLLAANQESQ